MVPFLFDGNFAAQSKPMISKETLKFLTDLKENNNRPWFEANRNRFEKIKTDFELFAEQLRKGIASFDTDIASLEIKHCTFRQYRDVRFSKDKRPYKINMGAYFNKGGKKLNTAGYYFHLEPGKSIIAGGLWMPEGPQLAKVRQEIDYNFDEWKSIISKPSFKKYFRGGLSTDEKLQRQPKGYTDDNPAIEYLKLKSFVARQPVHDDELMKKNTSSEIIKSYKALKPMIDFLNRADD